MAAVKKSVSVKDVARLAGVSEQTVSRTVHDSPSVRPETKERVRAAMRELGYRPNFAGRSLRRGKFKTVGVAMFNITGTGNLDRMEGFAAAADKHGYAITLTKVDGHPYTLEGASSRMSALPVDGIIVVTSPQDLVSMIVGKAVKMAKMMNIPVLGIVENYSYLVCPDCGKKISVFGESHLDEVAKEYGIPVLAQIPIRPAIAKAVDEGTVEYVEADFLDDAVKAVKEA